MDFNIATPNGFGDVLVNQMEMAVSSAIRDTLDVVKDEWEQTARKKLKSTYPDYYMGLNEYNSVEFPDPFTGVLTLRGKWANMLETGFPAFDMKQGFENSGKVKQKKDGGWYLTIPLRQRTPNSTGMMVGGNPMPRDIYSMAKQLQPQQRLTGTEMNYPPQASWTGYQHKNGLYEGMVRNVKQYANSTQGTYYTFRRVSDKSDPMAWLHPGYEGVHAMNHVRTFAEDMLNVAVTYYVKQVMG